MKVHERMLKYISIPTPSDSSQKKCPSTKSQFDLAYLLINEMKDIGILDVVITKHCFIYAKIPATLGYESKSKIGFIAHLDTVSDFTNRKITPLIHHNYNGKDIILGNSGLILKTSDFSDLSSCKGQTLITSDGNTILGADNKAGIAEILAMAEVIIKEKIPHGTICIAFTPDEEMYNEINYFDIDKFGADYAFTVDGNDIGEIQYENFYASQATFEISGFSAHPDSAKDKMINASLIAMEINSLIPKGKTPRDTEGYEGYFHLSEIIGTVDYAKLIYSIRDYDKRLFDQKINLLLDIEKYLNQKWGNGTVSISIKRLFSNMAEVINLYPHLIENTIIACNNTHIKPRIIAARGITSGCRLSFQGLPCPNIGTGGNGYHTPYEHITVEKMEKNVQMLVELIKIYAK